MSGSVYTVGMMISIGGGDERRALGRVDTRGDCLFTHLLIKIQIKFLRHFTTQKEVIKGYIAHT